jgi:hypothetical protein
MEHSGQKGWATLAARHGRVNPDTRCGLSNGDLRDRLRIARRADAEWSDAIGMSRVGETVRARPSIVAADGSVNHPQLDRSLE